MNSCPRKKITVIGSSNTDMIIKADRLPVPGETVLGGTFQMSPGGKGANQAIACSRLGADVSLITRIGNDLFGMQSMEIYRSESIDTSYVFIDEMQPSGVAMISIDGTGENSIMVAGGANQTLSVENISSAAATIHNADIILLQLEIPLDTVRYAVDIAFRSGKKIILNPAPAAILDNSIMDKIYAILPNKIEAEMLSGIKISDLHSAHDAAYAIKQKGVRNVVITMGREGAFFMDADGNCNLLSANNIVTVDTTGAGDVFCGAFSVYLAEGHSLEDSVAFANTAASIAVTRIGAQSSIPYRTEIDKISADRDEKI